MKEKFNFSNDHHLLTFLTSLFQGLNLPDISAKAQIKLLTELSNEKKIDLQKASKQIILLATKNHQYQVAEWLARKVELQWGSWSKDEVNEYFRYLARAGRYSFIHQLFSKYPKIKNRFQPSSVDNRNKTFLDYFMQCSDTITNFFDDENDPATKTGVLKFLVKEGVVNLESEEGNKIFLTACAIGAGEIAGYVLTQNVAVATAKNNQGQTGMILASLNGHLEIISILGKTANQLPTEEEDENGITCLIGAGQNQYLPVIQALLKLPYNTKVNYQSIKTGKNVLMVIASRRERLIGPFFGICAFRECSEEEDLTIVKYLAQHSNLDITLTDNSGKTAYNLAEEAGNYLIARYLESLLGNNLEGITSGGQPNIEVESDNNNHDTFLSNDSNISSSKDQQETVKDDDLSNKNMISKNFELALKIVAFAIVILGITLGIPYYLAKSRKKPESGKV